MKAIVVEKYGPVENLVARTVPDAGAPEGRDLLIRYICWLMLHFIRVRLINNWVIRVEACSVNPIDMKVRAGTYDDYPGMYPSLQVIGTVLRVNNSRLLQSCSPPVPNLWLRWRGNSNESRT
jgi:hypothetical protein